MGGTQPNWSRTLFFDIESHSVTERYDMPPREYFRLGGFAWNNGPAEITDSYDEMMEVMSQATMIVAMNGHAFDMSVLFGPDSFEPVNISRRIGFFDPYIHATLALPAPEGYFEGRGGRIKCTKPDEYRRWYSLDNLAFQLGMEGKSFDLKKFAAQFEYTEEPVYSEKTGKLLKKTTKTPTGVCCGFGAIPLDNEEFRGYLEQDVLVLRDVTKGLLARMPFDQYAQREQLKAAVHAQISRNGFRADRDLIAERIYEQAYEAAYALEELHQRFGLPLQGKKPTASAAGKEAIHAALKSVGVRERDLLRTDKGALSLSGDSVIGAAEVVGTEEARHLAGVLAMLAGQRSLAELARESLHSDGKVHPSIDPLQRSGRLSTTKPGLTIWDDSHKNYWLADNDDEVLVEFDYSNADARVVAAESGDLVFARRFEPGQDGHMINALAAWGAETVATDPDSYRQRAKAPGHGWSYRIGAKKCAATTGMSLAEAKEFLGNLNKAFPGVVRWQNQVSGFGQANGFVINDWGRKMPITGSGHTQPPALIGQSSTNEILADGLLSMPERFVRMLKITVHDAVVASIPKVSLDRDVPAMVRFLSTSWKPKNGGQRIEFPVNSGPPGRNWKEAVHV